MSEVDTYEGRVAPPTREELRQGLEAVRERTRFLVAPVPRPILEAQHSELMSPIAWDLGHIAAFEELWLVRRLGQVSSEQQIEEMFDAFRTPRTHRGALGIPPVDLLERRLDKTRRAALERLTEVDLDSANPLLRDGYVYEMVRDHEAQHQETILQALLLLEPGGYRPRSSREPPPGTPGAPPPGFVGVEAGPFQMGDRSRRFAYDNERPAWEAWTGEYEIGRYPVTNSEYFEFIAAGGYTNPDLWSPEGWRWVGETGLYAPGGWAPGSDHGVLTPASACEAARGGTLTDWYQRTGLGERQLGTLEPVSHVCYWEAEAYARFAGARLPTEVEWEKAAAWDPVSRASRPYPWGHALPAPEHANLDQLQFGTAPVSAFPGGTSPTGCWAMLGDIWEWTSSPFGPYPGFEPFPYAEYSEVFFGDAYRVLRGGSWASRRTIARNSFRNWDYPIRRQIFSGFRLVRDVG